MRRRLSQLLLLVGLFCVSMFLLAGPAMATESSEDAEMSEEDHSEDESHAEEENQAMGAITAAIAGILLGTVCFAMSNPGDIERVSDAAHH